MASSSSSLWCTFRAVCAGLGFYLLMLTLCFDRAFEQDEMTPLFRLSDSFHSKRRVDGLLIEVLELRGCSRRQVPTNMRMPHQPTATLSPSLLFTVALFLFATFLPQPSRPFLSPRSFFRPLLTYAFPFSLLLQPFAPDYRSPVCPAVCCLSLFSFFLLISFSPLFSHFHLLCLVFLDEFSLPVLCSVCFFFSLSLFLSCKLLLYLKYIQYDQ